MRRPTDSTPSPFPGGSHSRRHVPTSTWIGGVGTVLVGMLGLASGGVWSMVMSASIVVLLTAVYGLLFRRRTWIRLPRKRSAAAIGAGVAFAVLIGSGAALGATHPTIPHASVQAAASQAAARTHVAHSTAVATPAHRRSPSPSPTPTPTPVITTTTVSETAAVPFTSTTIDDPSAPAGTTHLSTAGVDGVQTTTYEVTLTDGTETARRQVSQAVTTPPVTQVTAIGSHVAPAPAPAPAAPAPAAPAPAPAGVGTVDPGGFCSPGDRGVTALAANGRSYTCGGKGPDASGHLHWNTIG